MSRTKPRGRGKEGRPNGEAGSVATFFPEISFVRSMMRVPVSLAKRETVPYDTFFYFAKRMSMELYVSPLPVLDYYSGT